MSTPGDIVKTAPKYRLYYFNACGLAEPIRYLLSYCGIPFEDVRLDYETEWIPVYKKEMPMEQVPVLEIDDVRYHQHLSICRLIARNNSLNGSSAEEACEIEAIVEDVNDMRLAIGLWFKEDEPAMKAVLRTRADQKIPFYMRRFESLVVENDGFFVGTKLSWVDIYYAAIIESMGRLMQQDLEANYPALRKMSGKIRGHMMIAPYIANRPESQY